MNRLEALKAAEESVERQAAPVLNSRGYPEGGYRAPTFEERRRAVLSTAAFLLGEEVE